jgi:hypothetical protein
MACIYINAITLMESNSALRGLYDYSHLAGGNRQRSFSCMRGIAAETASRCRPAAGSRHGRSKDQRRV